MEFSVWRPERAAYDYYETPAVPADVAKVPAPRHLNQVRGTKLGLPIEKVGWRLPPAAKLIGSGTLPKGRIALQQGLIQRTLGDTAFRPSGFLFWTVGGIILWKWARKKGRRR